MMLAGLPGHTLWRRSGRSMIGGMPKTEPSPMYACMMPKSNLRRVQQPHDERVVITRHPLQRVLAKLTGAVRR